MLMTLREIAAAIHGEKANIDLAPLNIEATGISTDTRTLAPGDLFVALKGENFDGHDHIADAFEKGAIAAVVDWEQVENIPSDLGILIGSLDTQVAFGQIARAWRRKFDIPVIGVTGSVGKTTTKEMLAAALSPLGRVLKTEKNENNEIGVPKVLLRLDEYHAAAVIEMGMRGLGQIEYLASVAEPTVGVITLVGENHIELLGSLEKIAEAKGELVASLPANGLAVLNADDPFTNAIAQRSSCPVATFGASESATMRATEIGQASEGLGWTANVTFGGETGVLAIRSPSRHDLWNALSAVLVAVNCGVNFNDSLRAVAGYKNISMRMEVVKTASGAVILSDCYNAAPKSMRSAIDTLASYPGNGRKIAFLGDMKELGEFAPQMHADVVAHLINEHVTEAYSVGDTFGSAMTRAEQKFKSSAEAAEFARTRLSLSAGDVVLVKGSRAMTMEKIVEALTTR